MTDTLDPAVARADSDGRLHRQVSKASVNYRQTDSTTVHCTNCVHVQEHGEAASTCELVQGTVDRHHVCDDFDGGTRDTIIYRDDHFELETRVGPHGYSHGWIKDEAKDPTYLGEKFAFSGEAAKHDPELSSKEAGALASSIVGRKVYVTSVPGLLGPPIKSKDEVGPRMAAEWKNGRPFIHQREGYKATKSAILHESAHLLVGQPDGQQHGHTAEFRNTMIGLVGQHIGQLEANKLSTGYRLNGLKEETSRSDLDVRVGPKGFIHGWIHVGGLPNRTKSYRKRDLHAEGEWPKGHNPRYGAVTFNEKGQVLLREPTNHYDGYAWTFPKGGPEKGEHPVDSALRETLEETGHVPKIVGHVPGGFSGTGTSSHNHFYLAQDTKGMVDPSAMVANGETNALKWADPLEALNLISQSTNLQGRYRDLQTLKAALEAMNEQHGTHYPNIVLPPPPPKPPKWYPKNVFKPTDLAPAARVSYSNSKFLTSFSEAPKPSSQSVIHYTKPPKKGSAAAAMQQAAVSKSSPKVKITKPKGPTHLPSDWASEYDGDIEYRDSIHGHHIAGTTYHWKHGYIPLDDFAKIQLAKKGIGEQHVGTYKAAAAAAYKKYASDEQDSVQIKAKAAPFYVKAKKALAAGDHETAAQHIGTAHGIQEAGRDKKLMEQEAGVTPHAKQAVGKGGAAKGSVSAPKITPVDANPSPDGTKKDETPSVPETKPAAPASIPAVVGRAFVESELAKGASNSQVSEKISKSGMSNTEKMAAKSALLDHISANSPTVKKLSPMENAPPGGWTEADKVPKEPSQAVAQASVSVPSTGKTPADDSKYMKNSPKYKAFNQGHADSLNTSPDMTAQEAFNYAADHANIAKSIKPSKGDTTKAYNEGAAAGYIQFGQSKNSAPPVEKGPGGSFAQPAVPNAGYSTPEENTAYQNGYEQAMEFAKNPGGSAEGGIGHGAALGNVEGLKSLLATDTSGSSKKAAFTQGKIDAYTNYASMHEEEPPDQGLAAPSASPPPAAHIPTPQEVYPDTYQSGHDHAKAELEMGALSPEEVKAQVTDIVGANPDVSHQAYQAGALDAISEHEQSQGPAADSLPPASSATYAAAEKINGPTGSNPAQWYKMPDGSSVIVKQSPDVEHAFNEVAVNEVYKAAGIPTPSVSLVDGGEAVASKKVDDLTPWKTTAKNQAAARKGFGIDALTSNWDALGLVDDNAFTDKNGNVVRIDNGGGGMFRAMGSPKGNAFKTGDWSVNKNQGNAQLNDYNTLLHSEQGKKLYGADSNMSDSTKGQIDKSLDEAANLDLNKVKASLDAQGIPASFSDPFIATLDARQTHLKSLGYGGKKGITQEATPSVSTPNQIKSEILGDTVLNSWKSEEGYKKAYDSQRHSKVGLTPQGIPALEAQFQATPNDGNPIHTKDRAALAGLIGALLDNANGTNDHKPPESPTPLTHAKIPPPGKGYGPSSGMDLPASDVNEGSQYAAGNHAYKSQLDAGTVTPGGVSAMATGMHAKALGNEVNFPNLAKNQHAYANGIHDAAMAHQQAGNTLSGNGGSPAGLTVGDVSKGDVYDGVEVSHITEPDDIGHQTITLSTPDGTISTTKYAHDVPLSAALENHYKKITGASGATQNGVPITHTASPSEPGHIVSPAGVTIGDVQAGDVYDGVHVDSISEPDAHGHQAITLSSGNKGTTSAVFSKGLPVTSALNDHNAKIAQATPSVSAPSNADVGNHIGHAEQMGYDYNKQFDQTKGAATQLIQSGSTTYMDENLVHKKEKLATEMAKPNPNSINIASLDAQIKGMESAMREQGYKSGDSTKPVYSSVLGPDLKLGDKIYFKEPGQDLSMGTPENPVTITSYSPTTLSSGNTYFEADGNSVAVSKSTPVYVLQSGAAASTSPPKKVVTKSKVMAKNIKEGDYIEAQDGTGFIHVTDPETPNGGITGTYVYSNGQESPDMTSTIYPNTHDKVTKLLPGHPALQPKAAPTVLQGATPSVSTPEAPKPHKSVDELKGDLAAQTPSIVESLGMTKANSGIMESAAYAAGHKLGAPGGLHEGNTALLPQAVTDYNQAIKDGDFTKAANQLGFIHAIQKGLVPAADKSVPGLKHPIPPNPYPVPEHEGLVGTDSDHENWEAGAKQAQSVMGPDGTWKSTVSTSHDKDPEGSGATLEKQIQGAMTLPQTSKKSEGIQAVMEAYGGVKPGNKTMGSVEDLHPGDGVQFIGEGNTGIKVQSIEKTGETSTYDSVPVYKTTLVDGSGRTYTSKYAGSFPTEKLADEFNKFAGPPKTADLTPWPEPKANPAKIAAKKTIEDGVKRYDSDNYFDDEYAQSPTKNGASYVQGYAQGKAATKTMTVQELQDFSDYHESNYKDEPIGTDAEAREKGLYDAAQQQQVYGENPDEEDSDDDSYDDYSGNPAVTYGWPTGDQNFDEGYANDQYYNSDNTYAENYAEGKAEAAHMSPAELNDYIGNNEDGYNDEPVNTTDEAIFKGKMDGAQQFKQFPSESALPSIPGTQWASKLLPGDAVIDPNDGKAKTVKTVSAEGGSATDVTFTDGTAHLFGSSEILQTTLATAASTAAPSVSTPTPPTKGKKTFTHVMAKNLKPGDQILHKPYAGVSEQKWIVSAKHKNGALEVHGPAGNTDKLSLQATDKVTKLAPGHPQYMEPENGGAISSVSPPKNFQEAFQKAQKLKNLGKTEALPNKAAVLNLPSLSAYQIGHDKAVKAASGLPNDQIAQHKADAEDRQAKAISSSEQAAYAGMAHGFHEATQAKVEKQAVEDTTSTDVKTLPIYTKELAAAEAKRKSGATSQDLYAIAGPHAEDHSPEGQARYLAYQKVAEQADFEEGEKPTVAVDTGAPDLTPAQVDYMTKKAKEGKGLTPKSTTATPLELWAYDQGRAIGINTGNNAAADKNTAYSAADIEKAALQNEEAAKKAVGAVESARFQGIARGLHRVALAKQNGDAEEESGSLIKTGQSTDAAKPDVKYHAPGYADVGSSNVGQYTALVPFTPEEVEAIGQWTTDYRYKDQTPFLQAVNIGLEGKKAKVSDIQAPYHWSDSEKQHAIDEAETFMHMADTKSIPSAHTIYRGTSGKEWTHGQLAAWKAQIAKGETVDFSMPISSSTYDPNIWNDMTYRYVIDPGALTADIGKSGNVGHEIETVTGGLMEVYDIGPNPVKPGQTLIKMRQVSHYAH